jgi:dTDP-4-amino-4,6-dideoxygalactose transaminase
LLRQCPHAKVDFVNKSLLEMSDKSIARRIPLQAPFITDEDRRSVFEAISSDQVAGSGPVCKEVEAEISRIIGSRYVFLTTSCTHALELAALSLDLKPGDEVILPSFTFTSTANAFLLRDAKLVFADIDPATFNLDPNDVRKRITPRTKAIVLVHYAGMPCEMDAFQEIAQKHGLALVEDAAQAVDARWNNQHLGTIGDIGCFSFHSTKNITCGEGGAFLTNNPRIAERADVIREKGTNRHAFLRGEIDRYSWVDSGSSYVLSDLLAALLRTQLANRATIKALRKKVWHRYLDALLPLRDKHGLTLPTIPKGADPNYHLFPFLVSSSQRRNHVLDHLHHAGIGATFHYVPLHSAPCMLKRSAAVEDLPVTTMVSERLIRLPLFPGLADEDVARVVRGVVEALDGK